MALYRVHIIDSYDKVLLRISAERGEPVENLIEIAAEEAALEYAKKRGWPLPTYRTTPSTEELNNVSTDSKPASAGL